MHDIKTFYIKVFMPTGASSLYSYLLVAWVPLILVNISKQTYTAVCICHKLQPINL